MYENTKEITLPAGSDFTEARAHLVTLATDGRLDLATNGDGTPPVGIVAMNADSSAVGTVVPVTLITAGGIMTGIAGGTVTRGQILVADATGANSAGRLVGVANMAALSSNDMGVGISMEGASNGDPIMFLAMPVFKSA